MSRSFERRIGKEIEDLIRDYKIDISYDITMEEQRLYQSYSKILVKMIIPLEEWDFDIILYIEEHYPFRPPNIILRRNKNAKVILNIWNENISEEIIDYLGEGNYEYFIIQSFICYFIDHFCKNEDEKKIFLDWKFGFDKTWYNHYVATTPLRMMIPEIEVLMNLIKTQLEKIPETQI